MVATIHTMFVNEKIIRIYSFVSSHHDTQDKCILSGVLGQKLVPPPWPPKIPHCVQNGRLGWLTDSGTQ